MYLLYADIAAGGSSTLGGQGMLINMSDLIYALSTALDFVEKDQLGAATNHAKRVAYLSIRTGKLLGLDDGSLDDLGCVAALHDNALSENATSELLAGRLARRARPSVIEDGEIPKPYRDDGCGSHCEMGERNVSKMPFYPRVKNVIYYHHENHDGSGPFKLAGNAIPLYSRIVHAADLVDISCNLGENSEERFKKANDMLRRYRGVLFDPDVTDAMLEVLADSATRKMENSRIEDLLHLELPDVTHEYGNDEMMGIASIFARIVDFKSPFTRRHSEGIATKAFEMGEYYDMGIDMQTKLYLAGSFHDLGKLAVTNDILDKPGKLTGDEFAVIQNHAWWTYDILRRVRGLEEITLWAALHHEKLDGSGYPFGKRDYELSMIERMMGCVDIYQALTEDRPYRQGMGHAEAMKIMDGMVRAGKIDGRVVSDIDARYR